MNETFQKELSRELGRWRIATVTYGFTYYFTRIVLIVASGIVAANANLSHGKASSMTPMDSATRSACGYNYSPGYLAKTTTKVARVHGIERLSC